MKQLMSDRFRGFLPVVVDVETGGFNSETDALLEIGAVILSINEQGGLTPGFNLFHSIIPFQGANIEQAALDITGIKPNDPYRTATDEKEALTSFLMILMMQSNLSIVVELFWLGIMLILILVS